MKKHRAHFENVSDDPATACIVSTPTEVCSYIAAAGLNAHPRDEAGECDGIANAIGSITLHTHQQNALRRVRTAIGQHHGALLADAVGLGKTFVALALARDYAHVNVLAPAALLPMWRDAITRAGASGVALHSLHTLSRRALPSCEGQSPTLTIIDEAHHLRTRNTVRYEHAQKFVAGHDVLLMTATPVHNRVSELRNLLALFLGNRSDVLDREIVASCVVRQTATDEQQQLVPAIRERPAHTIPDNRALLETILLLPPPLPVNEGTAASALVRLGLLRAWCSSDAALADRIRRRQLRGEAMLHSLVNGRYPTQHELESWIVGADSVQLGFAELLVATTCGDTSAFIKTLTAHLDGLDQLLQLHTRTSTADPARASLLRAMLRDDPHRPIVAFSQFASTVRALHRALGDLAGIASLTSDGGRIASGAIARHELIANFAPRASGRPPPAAAQRVRLLLSTDLLAEGVNLQDAGTIVHLDLPWTHALRQQRVGRVARIGSLFECVDVHTLAPPMGAESALHMIATLERKAGIHRDWIGSETSRTDDTPSFESSAARAHTASGSAPDNATELHRLWRKWNPKPVPPSTARIPVASVASLYQGWIAAVNYQSVFRVVAHVSTQATAITQETSHERQTEFGRSPGTSIELLLLAAKAASGFGLPPDRSQIRCAIEQLDQWIRTQQLHDLAGGAARTLSPAHKRALATLASQLRSLTAVRRTPLASRASELEQQILAARGAELERQIDAWTQTATDLAVDAWLRTFPRIMADRRNARVESIGSNARVVALLLLQPCSHSRESLE